ncbi:hypothetical protein AB0B48_09985 [Micromonospora sp. NPDC049089]|uniref:hypothetical protein n=1 Tax=unclassified Micromonospora TaxID=2617518 RepID=UPI00341043E4
MVAIDHETVNLMHHVPHPTTVAASGQIERSGKADVQPGLGRTPPTRRSWTLFVTP